MPVTYLAAKGEDMVKRASRARDRCEERTVDMCHTVNWVQGRRGSLGDKVLVECGVGSSLGE
jgi:hypothetical protein